MSNPFPGMDPYLEDDLWTSVHTDLCSEIVRQLAPKLRPKYAVLSARRVIVAPPDEGEDVSWSRFPDVGVLATGAPDWHAAGTLTAPVVLPVALSDPIPQISVEIRDVAQRRLVTCIEVLSPTNKQGPGREEYAGKRLQMLAGDAHLVEVDLLRVGSRFPTAQPLPDAPYFVFISHAGRRRNVDVWPIALDQPLPTFPIPMLPDDPPVPLDLQQALSVVYEIIGYDELIDYRQPLPGPLTPAQAAWVEERLKRAGRR